MLNDADLFAKFHKERLKNLKVFKFKGYLRKFNEQGKLEMAQQLLPEEEFWEEEAREDRQGNVRKQLSFNYVNAMVFLQNRGFWRYQMRSGAREFVITSYSIHYTKLYEYTGKSNSGSGILRNWAIFSTCSNASRLFFTILL